MFFLKWKKFEWLIESGDSQVRRLVRKANMARYLRLLWVDWPVLTYGSSLISGALRFANRFARPAAIDTAIPMWLRHSPCVACVSLFPSFPLFSPLLIPSPHSLAPLSFFHRSAHVRFFLFYLVVALHTARGPSICVFELPRNTLAFL